MRRGRSLSTASSRRGIRLREATGRELDRSDVLLAVWRRLLGAIDRAPDLVAEAAWLRLAWREEVVETEDGTRGRIRGFAPGGELILESAGKLVRVTTGEGLRRAAGFRG